MHLLVRKIERKGNRKECEIEGDSKERKGNRKEREGKEGRHRLRNEIETREKRVKRKEKGRVMLTEQNRD